jgi:flagellar hook-associated protein 3 FlgL
MTNVSTSAFYESAIFNMTKLRESTNKLQQQLSTSSKLTHSYDDPLAAAQMRAMQAADTLSTADTATTTAAKSLLSQTDDTLSQFATVVSQLQTLATQAANGTLNTTDRAALGTQLAAYYQNLTSLANTTNADGHALFGGQGTGSAYVTDASGNMIYNGTGTASTLSLGPGFSVTTSVTGPDFLNFTGADGTAKNLFSVVKNLATTLQDPTTSSAAGITAAQSAMKDLNIGLDSISTSQTVVGARLAWIDTTSSMQTQINTLRSTNEASTGGTDYAATAALLSQQMTVLSASQASFMKVASLSLMTYLN